jgi:hypothetical protein
MNVRTLTATFVLAAAGVSDLHPVELRIPSA